MGAWGTGLYEDDTCCDVRDDYVRNLKRGLPAEESWRVILARYGTLLDDKALACLVCFALADTAWKYGRLHPELKARALALLESGGDVFVWERDAPAEAEARRGCLQRLEARLRATQPAEKPLKLASAPEKKVRTTAPVGSVFALSLPSGNLALLTIAGFRELEASVDPVFTVANWRGTALPASPEATVTQAPALRLSAFTGERAHVAILPGDERRSIMSNLHPLGLVVAPPPYVPDSTVWLSIGRIAREIDAWFEHAGIRQEPDGCEA